MTGNMMPPYFDRTAYINGNFGKVYTHSIRDPTAAATAGRRVSTFD